MSRYRKVDPRIWNDENFRNLSDGAKLAFFMLLTHPSMTALGAMRATLPGLAAEIGWDAEAFRAAFLEVSDRGMAQLDPKACLVALPNFLKYNPPESPNVVKAWAGSIDLLPECMLKSLVLQRAQGFAEGMSDAFQKAFHEAFPKGMPNQEQEQEQEQKQKNDQKPSSPAAPEDVITDDPKRQKRDQSLAAVADLAIGTFNASKLVKPNGGMLATVNGKVGRENRQRQFQRCIAVARQICAEEYQSDQITGEFLNDYWAAVHADDFLSGRVRGGRGHENWLPDFEFLTRVATMLRVYDRAAAELPA